MKKITLFVLLVVASIGAYAQLPNYVPTNGLCAFYTFSGNAVDSSINGNNGTVYGATLTTDRLCHANSAYFFNGSTDYIDVPNSSSLTFPNNSITVAFWGKIISVPSTGGYDGIILSKQAGSGNSMQGFNVQDNNNDNTGLLVSNGGGNFAGTNTDRK